jgi:hypothetical protein
MLPSDQPTSEQELIAEAHESSLLAALESFYMDGVADDVDGDVESPLGHFYRVDRWIVVTDSQGFHDVRTYANVDEAKSEFAKLQQEFDRW